MTKSAAEAARERAADFGTKVLQDPHKVVPKREDNPFIDLDIKLLIPKQGNEMTCDAHTDYREFKIEAIKAWATIGELKERVEKQEKIPVDDQRFFCHPHLLPDDVEIGQCYVNWMGYGMERWPPRFVIKPAPKGVEVVVDIPPMRDTAVWDEGDGWKLKQYGNLFPIFDVSPDEHTVTDLKEMIAAKIRMPANRHLLYTQVMNEFQEVEDAQMDNDKLLSEYDIQQGSLIMFQKNDFDENGFYIFDDAYYDENGYHPRPKDSHIVGPISCKYGNNNGF